MNIKPIIIVWGEPNSIFSEIFLKSIKKFRLKRPIILIGCKKLFFNQLKMIKIKFNKKKFQDIFENLKDLKKNKINFLDVNYNFKKPFEKISSNSNLYISKCFDQAFKILNKYKNSDLINGPISKKFFLAEKYEGITEMLSHKYKRTDKTCMLIYHKELSVSPITTHLPISKVSNHLTIKKIIQNIELINNFYKKKFSKVPRIALCGLNPHCENFYKIKTEEDAIIIPAIKILKKNFNVKGPFSTDTMFIKKIRSEFDVIVGMYHDQVLTPIKTIYGFDPINITLGLPFVRISPDHGPNFNMIGLKKSNPQSLINSIKFLNNLK